MAAIVYGQFQFKGSFYIQFVPVVSTINWIVNSDTVVRC